MKSEYERWDDAYTGVICIKEYESLKVGSCYQIKGRGNLDFNCDPNVGGKKGYGYSIEDDRFNCDKVRDWWKLPLKDRTKWYYFTLKEMSEYFITEQENYDIWIRDNKIKQILND